MISLQLNLLKQIDRGAIDVDASDGESDDWSEAVADELRHAIADACAGVLVIAWQHHD